MNDYSKSIVVKNWNEMKECFFAEKRWVNPKDVDVEKEYEKGDFLRVWCAHDQCWCQAELGPEYCCIYTDHRDE
ncbi:TPA: hypothetical protein ACF2DS_001264 [Clostridium perfringens]|uniref:hypothetical protein n=1 Tax=Clostridium perfringens TaxID=1502 RepID=UPI0018AA0677|nr:hypothetical protein [Clostridium perfringens]EHR1327345.1 hypothetical protein [Clostridium perfringens]EHR1330478.1 hypothetical protein [Clostridium perfringens]EHR1423955.1 hypothetical protein [Clostridium perfringens]EIF6165434.1 hypothetical protein [Clostridium perfringens]MBI5985936.1 hypothetical protein [Clostridium perfringens]